jgi:hypothetical protein
VPQLSHGLLRSGQRCSFLPGGRWFPAEAVTAPVAQFLDVILYSREQLLKEYEALPYKDGAQDQARPCLAGPALAWLPACLPACLPRPALAWLPACLPARGCPPTWRPPGSSTAAGLPAALPLAGRC